MVDAVLSLYVGTGTREGAELEDAVYGTACKNFTRREVGGGGDVMLLLLLLLLPLLLLGRCYFGSLLGIRGLHFSLFTIHDLS